MTEAWGASGGRGQGCPAKIPPYLFLLARSIESEPTALAVERRNKEEEACTVYATGPEGT